jgi:hypothetical protein
VTNSELIKSKVTLILADLIILGRFLYVKKEEGNKEEEM